MLANSWPNFSPPLPDRFVTDLDAPERQHLLHHPKAERKAKGQPDRVADQLGREAVAGVGVLGRARHARLIADPRPSGNPALRQLDDASRFCTGPSGSCDDAVHSPCTASGLSGAAGRLYTYPSAAATAPTAIFAPRSCCRDIPYEDRAT